MDDDVFELNSDTRLVYLCLLTNPQRDLLPAFRCSDRMLSAYTGYDKDLIESCRQELVDAKRIFYEEGFYIFTKQDFVKPSAGRDSSTIYEREYAKLPATVKAILDEIEVGDSTGNTTGTTSGSSTGHIYINKDININNKKEYSEDDIRITENLFATVAKLYPTYKKLVERKATDKDYSSIDKLHRIDGNDYKLIDDILEWLYKGYKPSENFDWRDQIKSTHNLRKHFDKLRIQYEKDKKQGRYRSFNYDSTPPQDRKPTIVPKEPERIVDPQEAEKNRIILELVRKKRATFVDMKELKLKTVAELKGMLV